MDNSEILHGYLHKLGSVGLEGFEGLIAKLLENLTGRHFYLAKSGYQAGRDMSTTTPGENKIAVECKRYLQSTPLNDREILGELVQVIQSIPDLDLWILVASRKIDSIFENSLRLFALKMGFEILIIDTTEISEDLPSSLEIICANAPQVVMQFMEQYLSKDEMFNLKNLLVFATETPGYSKGLSKLKDSFSAEFIGYDNWRHNQNKWLLNHFESDIRSRATFGQIINVSDAKVRVIDRKDASEEFDRWLSSWSDHYNIFALLGEEGDGKTWAVASWVKKCIESSDNFSTVMLLTSTNAYLTTEPLDLLARTIANQFKPFDEIYWKNRLVNWIDRPDHGIPFIVLILDGLNERHDFNWKALLDKFSDSPWKERVALILTCRTLAWETNFSSLTHLSIHPFALKGFSDDEFLEALRQRGFEPSDIAPTLLRLMRKPRYFDLVLRLRATMAESGDVTIERLLYEDWRDRISKKSELNLDHDQFQALIRDLGEKDLVGKKAFSRREVEELIPTDQRQIIEDLISSGVLTRAHALGKFKVDKRRLIHGFGLLLKEEVLAAISTSSSMDEAISRLLEPQRDMDIKVAICGAAVFHSLVDQDFPEEGRLRLLLEWINGRNLEVGGKDDLIAYIPYRPEIYMRFAEIIWSDAHENSMGQELLMRGFLKWRNNKKVRHQLVPAIERWMGFINRIGFPIQRGVKREKDDEIKQNISERLKCDLTIGSLSYEGYEVSVIDDDGLLRLARVALAIISYSQRRPFIKAMVKWSLTRAIMDFPNESDLVSWVLKTTKEDIWEELELEIQHLISIGSIVALQAAYRLLSLFGTAEAYKIKKTLPEDLFPSNPVWEFYQQNLCRQLLTPWQYEDYSQCLEQADLPAHYIAHNLRNLSLDPDLPVPTNLEDRLSVLYHYFSPDSLWIRMSYGEEDHRFSQFEQTMYAFAPYTIAQIVKNTICDATNRKEIALRQLSLKIKPNLLILGVKDKNAVGQAWNFLERSVTSWGEFDKVANAYLFHAILWGISAEEQLELIISRSNESIDLLEYEKEFKPLDSQRIDDILKDLIHASDTNLIRRVLWFVSANTNVINQSSIKYILTHLNNQNAIIRSTTLEIIYKSKESNAITNILNSSWSWCPSNDSFRENYWGSILLSDFGKSFTFHEIQTRIHPVYWGYALERRGLKEAEILQFADDVHTIWETIRTKCPPLPINFPSSTVENNCKEGICPPGLMEISPDLYSHKVTFLSKYAFWGGMPNSGAGSFADGVRDALDPRKFDDKIDKLWNVLKESAEGQLSHGNIWFCERFYKYGLKQVYELRPDLIKTWIQAVYADSTDSKRLLFLCKSFYGALASILFETDPSAAINLFIRIEESWGGINFIDSNTGILCLYYDMVNSKKLNEIYKILNYKLGKCCSDLQLFELALLAQQTDNYNWLKETINRYQGSDIPYDKAISITLSGYLEDDEMEAHFASLFEEDESWLTSVAKKSYGCWKRNKWAKKWLFKFLNEENEVRAWAAFKLFLKCTDRRYWIWRSNIIDEVENNGITNEQRLIYLELNQSEIKSSIVENEKERGNCYLSEKILKAQVWPWMDNLIN